MDDPEVSPQEPLATFVIESNKFRGNNLHFKALMPGGPDANRSVFRTLGCTDAEIQAIGVAEVATPRGKTLLGWGTVKTSAVRQLGLHVRRDEPPPLHAVIENWPNAVEDKRALAMELAAQAEARAL
jgi:hypothetical protein